MGLIVICFIVGFGCVRRLLGFEGVLGLLFGWVVGCVVWLGCPTWFWVACFGWVRLSLFCLFWIFNWVCMLT